MENNTKNIDEHVCCGYAWLAVNSNGNYYANRYIEGIKQQLNLLKTW
jgi:hypothetical protein